MSKPAFQPGDTRILAALHAVGGAWHGVVARLEPQRPVYVDAKTFADSDAAGLEAWLASHNVGRVLSVLPASAIICRTCTLPNGSPTQLDAALKLQAETQLLGSIPTHRLATAVLQAAEGESSRSGLILAWPDSSTAPRPPVARDVTYTPVVASLAALLNGSRPVEPLMFVDRKDGSLALAMTHANGAMFRAARIDGATEDDELKSIQRTVAETALSVAHTGQFVDDTIKEVRQRLSASSSDATLIVPQTLQPELGGRLHGAPGHSTWWSTFGIAAGAALAASDPLASLTHMRLKPAATKPSRIRSMTTSFSDRKVALKLFAASLAIIVFSPVVFSGMRLLLLTIRYPNLEDRLADIEESEQALAMYADLKNHAWSMTKILSDVACSAPEGIDLESIAIDHGKEVRINGTAKSHKEMSPTEVVGQMQANMQQFRIFKDVRPSWDNSNAQMTSFEFSLMARVDDAFVRPTYPELLDFAVLTLADRKYGKQPKPGENAPDSTLASADSQADTEDLVTDAAPPEEDPATLDESKEPEEVVSEDGEEDSAVALNDRQQGRRPIGRDRTGTAGDANTRGPSGDAPIADRIPEPLSEAQIAAMNNAEVRDAMYNVSRTLQREPGLDAETRDRLNNEFRLLRNRMRELE